MKIHAIMSTVKSYCGSDRQTYKLRGMNKPTSIKRPLYKELRDTLAAELASGVYPIGSRFPTEQDLCKRYKLGRHTVREALRLLQAAGLLSRQAGAGTTVIALTPPATYSYRIDSIDDLTRYAQATAFIKKQEGMVTVREALARTLGTDVGSRWLRFAGVRHAVNEELRVAWTEIYVAEPYIAVRDNTQNATKAIYQKITEQFGFSIARVERQIVAVPMPADMATALLCEPGTPALMERRRYWSNEGVLFEVSLSFHPGDRFPQTIMVERET